MYLHSTMLTEKAVYTDLKLNQRVQKEISYKTLNFLQKAGPQGI